MAAGSSSVTWSASGCGAAGSARYDPPMAAPRPLILVIVLTLAGCSSAPTPAPSPSASTAAEPTPTAALAVASATPVPLPEVTPAIDEDLSSALQIAPPFDFEPPSSSDIDRLSGNILGLPSDLAETAGAAYAPSDFPMGYRFVREAETSIGVIVIIALPTEVAGMPGLLESIVAAVALEVNAIEAPSYETIQGVKVGLVRGPIANSLAIVHGHLVMAQSGQPAVDPRDLMAAVIAGNAAGFGDAPIPTE